MTVLARSGPEVTVRPESSVGESPGGRGLRADIEGLRAVAVLSVVGYHVGLPLLGGGYVGVDVFFVISGFLITRQLVGELARRGSLDIPRFYARRARRLLPPALLVLVVTLVAAVLLVNPLRARATGWDGLWVLAGSLNWHLGQQGTDYLTASAEPSLLQHYWSLAVEEQFYLVWPVLLAATAWARRGRAGPGARALLARVAPALGVGLLLGSLAWSVWLTRHSRPWAFFASPTRAWELGLGAAVAIGSARLARVHPPRAALAGWLGLGAIGLAVFGFDDRTSFPGLAALVPVGGTALVLAAGCVGSTGAAPRPLGRRWLQLVGGRSYGWYLWHWPVLLLAPAVSPIWGDLRHRVLLAVIALGLAQVTYLLVERPARSMSWPATRPWRGLGVGLALAGTVAGAIVAAGTMLADPVGSGRRQQVGALPAGARAGARVEEALRAAAGEAPGGPAQHPAPGNLTPALADVGERDALPLPQRRGCHSSFDAVTADLTCRFGDPRGRRTMVLLGDSHALQWFPALDLVARRGGYRLLDVTKSSCTPMSVTVWNEAMGRPYAECDNWRVDALAKIVAARPDVVVLSTSTGVRAHGLRGGGAGFDAAWADGTARTVATLAGSGARVVLLEDTVNPGRAVPGCVAEHLVDVTACAPYRAGAIEPAARRAGQRAAARAAGARLVDPVPWLCAPRRCPVVVGNLLVYRDEQHLSTDYVTWLTPALGAALGPALGE